MRPDELQKYKAMNTRVEDKSGEELVSIISENVGRMLRRKMDAVTCIRMQAEAYAESWVDDEDGNFTYVSGKFSRVAGQGSPTLPENMEKNVGVYRSLRNHSPSWPRGVCRTLEQFSSSNAFIDFQRGFIAKKRNIAFFPITVENRPS